jgi:hypothetical protein
MKTHGNTLRLEAGPGDDLGIGQQFFSFLWKMRSIPFSDMLVPARPRAYAVEW